jgi:multimeric flavodoxin WrbA
MKILAVNGSPNKDGNTAAMLKEILKIAEREGARSDYIDLSEMHIHDCKACMKCKKGELCPQKDGMEAVRPLIMEADVLMLGSPVYMGDETGQMKCFTDRLYAFLGPGQVPGSYKSILEGQKRAIVLFTCQMTDGDKLYNYIAVRYFNLFINMLGYQDIRTFIIGGAMPGVDIRESPRAKGVLEESERFLKAI